MKPVHGLTKILTKKQFGWWKVICLSGRNSRGEIMWMCRCSCGTIRSVLGQSLRNGTSTNCGCKIKFHRQIPYGALFNSFKSQARYRKLDTDLGYLDFLQLTQIKECHYCGDEVRWTKHSLNRHGGRFNLDRKNNAVGYLKNNIVVCCKSCNNRKSDKFTYEQFIEIGKLIRKWSGR